MDVAWLRGQKTCNVVLAQYLAASTSFLTCALGLLRPHDLSNKVKKANETMIVQLLYIFHSRKISQLSVILTEVVSKNSDSSTRMKTEHTHLTPSSPYLHKMRVRHRVTRTRRLGQKIIEKIHTHRYVYVIF